MAKTRPSRDRDQRERQEVESAYRNLSGADRASRRSSGKKGAFQSADKKTQTIAIICISVAAVAILAAVILGYVYLLGDNKNGTILSNVTIAGVDVGGLNREEAIDAVEKSTKDTYTKNSMTVQVVDTTLELSPADTKAHLDVEAAVDNALAYGQTGFITKRMKERKIAQDQGYAVDLAQYLNLDQDYIEEQLDKVGEKYSSTLSQSTYNVVNQGTAEEKKEILQISLGTPEYSLDVQALLKQVLEAYNANNFQLEADVPTVEPDALDLDQIFAEYCTPAVDAELNDKYDIVESSDGYGFDLEKAKEQLAQAEYGSSLNFSFGVLSPKRTTEQLKADLFKDTLSSHTCYSGSSYNRQVNLSLACKAVNGKILKPGEVFSYNGTLGERTAEKGYKAAGAYVGNETVDTIGGGICQVSSTIYYCALMADLEIVDRTCHNFATGYLPLGMDATVDWGNLDFKFRNNTDKPIMIEASANGGSVSVALKGVDDKAYTVKMEYEVINTYGYKEEIKEFPPDNEKGYKDGEVVTTPYTGYDVKTYRCKYSKETGALISRDYEDFSDYKKRDKIICKIVDPNAPVEPENPDTPDTPDVPEPPVTPGGGNVSEGGQLPPE